MKKLLKISFVFFLLPSLAWAGSFYLPLDQIRFPKLDSKWDVQISQSDTPIQFTLKDESLKPGQFKSHVTLTKRVLKPNEQKNNFWKNAEKKNLPKNAQVLLNQFDPQRQLNEARFVTRVNLMPVSGSRITVQQGSSLYMLECESEQSIDGNLHDWCNSIFTKIEWGQNVNMLPDSKKLTFNGFVKNLDYRNDSLSQKIVELSVTEKPSYTTLKNYAYIVILQSVLDSSNNRNMLKQQTQDLVHWLQNEPKPIEPLTDWLQDNLVFLNGNFSEKTAEAIMQRDQRPPYWLIGLWLRQSSPQIALNLFERDPNQFPLKNYVMGQLYFENGNSDKAIEHLELANQPKNPEVMTQIAESYLEKGDVKNAQKWAGSARKAWPDNVFAKFAQARIFEYQDKQEQALEIYSELAQEPTLPEAMIVPVYTKYAEHSIETETRMQCYNKILEHNPKSLNALYALGRIYLLEKNDAQKGLMFFEKFVAFAPPGDPKVNELQGMIFQIRNGSAEDHAD